MEMYSTVLSLNSSEEIALTFDFCFSSSIFFLAYYSVSYLGYSIFGGSGWTGVSTVGADEDYEF